MVESAESAASLLLEDAILANELSVVTQRLLSCINLTGYMELVLLGAPVVFLWAYLSWTSLFRHVRILNLRSRLNWISIRRGELGALGARPHAPLRAHLGPRRRRFQKEWDTRQYVRGLSGRPQFPQFRSRRVERPELSRAQDLTTALWAWARSPDSSFFNLIAELARLDRVEQARIAGLVLNLMPLDGPQMRLPQNHAIPVHRFNVFQDRVKRLQLQGVLCNVRAGYGTLNGVAHVFAPFDLDWFPLLEVSESSGGRLSGGERLTVFRMTPRFTPLAPITNRYPKVTENYEEDYYQFSCDGGDSSSESETGSNEINRPRVYDSEYQDD